MIDSVRAGCMGVLPLTGRLETWQVELCEQPALLAEWLSTYGSPLNVLDPTPVGRNARELQRVAGTAGVDLAIHLARKANKALSFVDEARRLGLGVDVASERELSQTLDRGVPARDVVLTAAVKPRALLERAAAAGVTIVIDNADELRVLTELDAASGAPIAVRLAPVLPGRHPSRFGLGPDEILALADETFRNAPRIAGVHFHLDGYDARERVLALRQSLELVDALRARGHHPTFVDIGGGIPMSYLDDRQEWDRFWSEHHAALTGTRPSLTFEGHALGLAVDGTRIVGTPNVYPSHQEPTRGGWLANVLEGDVDGRTAAEALAARGLQLRCEPGRSLLDGCGLTVARVEFRKQRRDGTWLIGVAMNRTQCRSTADDFLVDPLLLRPGPVPTAPGPSRATWSALTASSASS